PTIPRHLWHHLTGISQIEGDAPAPVLGVGRAHHLRDRARHANLGTGSHLETSRHDGGSATGTPPGTTTIMPASFQMATGSQICVSGSVSQVVGTAYAQYWGGGVAFDLGDPGQMMPKVPWNRG